MQIYIGIDPSLAHTGLVALDATGRLLKAEPIKSKPAKGWRDQVVRIQHAVMWIQTALLTTRGAGNKLIILVEDYAPGRYMKTVIPSIEFGGVLRSMLLDFPEVYFVSPASVKKFVTGKGNADKLAVAVALSKRFNVDFGNDDNLWDAYSLARFAMAWEGKCTRLTQAQIKVVSDARKAAQNGKH